MNSYIIFLLLLSNSNIFYYEANITKTENFNNINNIIKFNNSNYKAGKFATNNKGDLILELSENKERNSSTLFYGLTKEGKYLFSNK